MVSRRFRGRGGGRERERGGRGGVDLRRGVELNDLGVFARAIRIGFHLSLPEEVIKVKLRGATLSVITEGAASPHGQRRMIGGSCIRSCGCCGPSCIMSTCSSPRRFPLPWRLLLGWLMSLGWPSPWLWTSQGREWSSASWLSLSPLTAAGACCGLEVTRGGGGGGIMSRRPFRRQGCVADASDGAEYVVL